MRQQTQLDLRVVHRQKDASLACRKRRLDGTTQLRARRDVLQVRVARGQTPRCRDGLVVRGVHATVTTAQRAQRIQIGGLDFGLFTPIQDQTHDFVVAGKVAQHLGVGRIVAALSLLEALGRKPHHIKEHVRQLHGTANIKGLVTITRLVLPQMVERNSGHIINLGSIAGTYPYPGGNVYGGTKAFIKQFSLNLRADLAGTQIRVTNVEPGLCGGTEFSNVRFKGDDARAEKLYENVEYVSPQDIANIVLWLNQQPEHVNINRIEVMPTAQTFAPLNVARIQK